MRINRTFIVAVSLVAGITLSQSVAASASAEEVPTVIEFTGETSRTVEYGQYWSFDMAGDFEFYNFVYGMRNFQVDATGLPAGYTVPLTMYVSGISSAGYLSAPYEIAPLGVGSYSFSISGWSPIPPDKQYTAQSSTSAQLTIEKAKLGMELRVLADPANSDGAIVTAKFTGRFVDEYSSSFFPGSALSPAGTWKITLTDANGEVATERNVERVAGDDVLATSFYWADAEPGEQYTASASFTPSGDSANNFAIGAAQDFAYTAPESARPVPTSSATAKPDTSLPEATGFSLPLWALILVIVLIVALGALVTIFSVRLSRRTSVTAGEVQS